MPFAARFYFGGARFDRESEYLKLNSKEERYFHHFSIPERLVIPDSNSVLQRLVDYLAQHPEQNHRYFGFCCGIKGERGFHQKTGNICFRDNLTDPFVPFLSFDARTGVVKLGPPIDDDGDKKDGKGNNKDDEGEEKKEVVKGKPKPQMVPQGQTQGPVDGPYIRIPETPQRMVGEIVESENSNISASSSQSTAFTSLIEPPSLDDTIIPSDGPLLADPSQGNTRPAVFSPESSQTLDIFPQPPPSESEAESTPTLSPVFTPHGVVYPRSPLGPKPKRQRRSSISA